MSELQTPTLEELAAEIRGLKERVEDLEDLRDLETAIQENAGKPLTDGMRSKKSWTLLESSRFLYFVELSLMPTSPPTAAAAGSRPRDARAETRSALECVVTWDPE